MLARCPATSPACLIMQTDATHPIDARGLRIGIAVSRYHSEITQSMLKAAVDCFVKCGGDQRDLHVFESPGSYELTALCRALAISRRRSGRPSLDAVLALGCIITGETTHDQHLAHSLTQGLTDITVQTGIPIAFGVLTCQSMAQAQARTLKASGRTNKGEEAMRAAIETARTVAAITSSRSLR